MVCRETLVPHVNSKCGITSTTLTNPAQNQINKITEQTRHSGHHKRGNKISVRPIFLLSALTPAALTLFLTVLQGVHNTFCHEF